MPLVSHSDSEGKQCSKNCRSLACSCEFVGIQNFLKRYKMQIHKLHIWPYALRGGILLRKTIVNSFSSVLSFDQDKYQKTCPK